MKKALGWGATIVLAVGGSAVASLFDRQTAILIGKCSALYLLLLATYFVVSMSGIRARVLGFRALYGKDPGMSYVLVAFISVCLGMVYWYSIDTAFRHWLPYPRHAAYAKHPLHIIFKDSPIFTPQVKTQIVDLMEDFSGYLAHLDIPVPDDMPPISIASATPQGQVIAEGFQGPYYRSNITLNKSALIDPKEITYVTAIQVIDRIVGTPPYYSGNPLYAMSSGRFLCIYFKWSYWNDKGNEHDRWANAFWEIRQKYGQEFADRLAAFTLRSIMDGPKETPPPLGRSDMSMIDRYIYKNVLVAESVVDNEKQKLGDIRNIFMKHELLITDNGIL